MKPLFAPTPLPRKSTATISPFGFNKYIFGSTVLSLITTALVIEVPFLADAFDFTTIDAREFFTALGLAFLIIPLVEIVKAIERAVIKNKAKKQTVK